ncbi:MAG TPA: lipoyl(octanoyl) transferase LipB [Conexibacter sp.]|jgi:lipoyl(octanoyl) transferase|nr:lipoyl(octanoyl) transferase LipB [Conexibacter sp.]
MSAAEPVRAAVGEPARDVAPRELLVVRLGTVEYRAALALQEAVRERRIADELPDVLLLVEHPPVYTRGRRSRDGDLPFAPEWYAEQGIDVVPVRRGGQLTYHGPGQLVGYPIMRIDDVIAYLRTMEEALIAALGDAGIAARNRPEDGIEYTGVWVDERKIASIGVHVSRHVTAHGFAVNVDNDMRPFEWAVACGLHGVQMTSLADEREATALTRAGRDGVTEPLALEREPSPALAQLADHVVARFSAAFDRTPVEAAASALGVPLRATQIAS